MGALCNLSCTGRVHADDARVAQVEHVAAVLELSIITDGDDVDALVTDELAELHALPAGQGG